MEIPNYRNGVFHNELPTTMMTADTSMLKTFIKFMRKPKHVNPPAPIPSVRRDLKAPPGPGTTITWFGHSSYLIQMSGLNILVDPVFSSHASPFPSSQKPSPERMFTAQTICLISISSSSRTTIMTTWTAAPSIACASASKRYIPVWA